MDTRVEVDESGVGENPVVNLFKNSVLCKSQLPSKVAQSFVRPPPSAPVTL